ncbi:MAG: CoA-binding protein [Balneolaceae bacterium]|nr:CoA-binding protein [Balneolaceae bacterium]
MRSTFNNWYDRKMRATPEQRRETEAIASLLREIRTIAIVGISRNRHKDSHYVGRYLQRAGYRIVPVNPGAEEILGETAWPDLASIPFPVDAVDLFRPPAAIPAAVEEALAVHPRVVWLQLGTGTHPEQKRIVEQAGITFVQNRCMKVDHQFLIRQQEE